MLLNNDPDNRWVNGTMGVYVRQQDAGIVLVEIDGTTQEVTPARFGCTGYEIDEDEDTEHKSVKTVETGSVTQFPLKLAYAMSIHKSQGMTLPTVAIDFASGAFAENMSYVALSRVKKLEGLTLVRPVTPTMLFPVKRR